MTHLIGNLWNLNVKRQIQKFNIKIIVCLQSLDKDWVHQNMRISSKR